LLDFLWEINLEKNICQMNRFDINNYNPPHSTFILD
jgi:hypothetical protein